MLDFNNKHPAFGAGEGAFPAVHYAIASKVTSTQTAFEVASEALQVFGGNGLSQEYPVEKLYRDAKIGSIYEGTSNMQLQTIAKLLLK